MEQFTLKWNNYYNQISDAFGSLLDEEDLVDVTLSCEGKKVKAHKMLLSACSSYFRDVFKENPCQHPVIVFRNVPFKDLSAIVEFIYKGEVSVAQEQLDSFLATAEMLAIKGLTDEDSSLQDDSPVIKQEPNKQPSRAVEKRKTTETSLLAKKIKSPPTKKRRPDESVGKPPDNLPVVLKVENITFEEDLNLDEGGNNLTEEVVQEFEQTETEEETSNIEEPMMYSKLPKTNDTVADEEMQGLSCQTPRFVIRFEDNKMNSSRSTCPGSKKTTYLNELELPCDRMEKRRNCRICPSYKDRKTQYMCIRCSCPICLECSRKLCLYCAPECVEKL